jgi:hypothetical protein
MNRSSRAFVLTDAVLGIAIMAFLTGVVVVDMSWRAKADKRLENFRAASAEAELVLSELHAGQSTGILVTSNEVHLEYPQGGARIPGYIWVRVIVTLHGQTVALVGLEKPLSKG